MYKVKYFCGVLVLIFLINSSFNSYSCYAYDNEVLLRETVIHGSIIQKKSFVLTNYSNSSIKIQNNDPSIKSDCKFIDIMVFEENKSNNITIRTEDKGKTWYVINQPDKMEEILISPNPAKNYLNIKFPDYIENCEFNVKIYDLLGNLLLEKKCDNYSIIDIADFTSGNYVLVINQKNSRYEFMITK